MRCVSVTLLLCLATMLLAQVTCQINGVSNCPCLRTSNQVPRKKDIENYMIQKAGICHIDAILFKTVSGRFICADPIKPWVKRAMEYVDNKKKAAETTACPINPAPTFTKASTPDTASDWNGQDELRTTAPLLLEFINKSIARLLCTCLKTSEAVLHKEDIKSYKIHKADICHIDAIEFKTVSGLTFCSNPQKPWVKRAIEFVDKKWSALETTAHLLNSAPTSKTTLTLDKASNWNGQDELKTIGHLFCPCLKISETFLHKEEIHSYKIHKADVCHFDAIEFKTVSGHLICANPLMPWVKRAMEFVDKKKKAVQTIAHPINSAPTFTTASTLDTASDWNGQDELRTTEPELLEYVYICL
uniref:Chemokine interleukin-8-like domain-containing protein n=1 Tax=Cyprinus carpio TaxID=7962 RepID=A0A8C1U6W1_CYPCA